MSGSANGWDRRRWALVGSLEHPSGEELNLYSVGALDYTREDVIAAHVAECIICEQTMRAFVGAYEQPQDEAEGDLIDREFDAIAKPQSPLPQHRISDHPVRATGSRLSRGRALGGLALAATVLVAVFIPARENRRLRQDLLSSKRAGEARLADAERMLAERRRQADSLEQQLKAANDRSNSTNAPSQPIAAQRARVFIMRPADGQPRGPKRAGADSVAVGGLTGAVLQIPVSAFGGGAFSVELFERTSAGPVLRLRVERMVVQILRNPDNDQQTGVIALYVNAKLLRAGAEYQIVGRSLDKPDDAPALAFFHVTP